MARYARITPGRPEKPIPISRPFSNFEYIDTNFRQDCVTLRRIMSQVRRHGGQTMIVEELNADSADDLRQENEDIRVRYPSFSESRIRRLSFFKKAFKTMRGLSGIDEKEFIGYVIIKEDHIPGEDWMSRIYESVICPSRHVNNFIKGSQTWKCSIAGEALHIQGYLYAQQNGITNVCAHVALRTAAAPFHKDGDLTYREMNELVGIDHVGRKLGEKHGGLGTDEMVQILTAIGAECFAYNYEEYHPDPPPFQKYLYGSVESGFPAIVCFRTARGGGHAVPVFGHTFNEDTWVPNAAYSYFRVGPGTAYIPSESWVSTYIGHDDNFGSNYCVPRRFLYLRLHCDEWPEESKPWCKMQPDSVVYVISTFPKGTMVSPVKAEALGADYLFSIIKWLREHEKNGNRWGERMNSYAKQNQLVLRPTLINATDYPQHLKKLSDWDGKHIKRSLIAELKTYLWDVFENKKVWMVELSIPELLSGNRRKLGEVLLIADVKCKPRNFKNFILARIPGYFATNIHPGPTNPKYLLTPNGAPGHVQLYGCEDYS